jgi:hypothetical protein
MKPEAIYRLKIPIRDCLGSVLPGLDNFPSIASPDARKPPGRPETDRPDPETPPTVCLLAGYFRSPQGVSIYPLSPLPILSRNPFSLLRPLVPPLLWVTVGVGWNRTENPLGRRSRLVRC